MVDSSLDFSSSFSSNPCFSICLVLNKQSYNTDYLKMAFGKVIRYKKPSRAKQATQNVRSKRKEQTIEKKFLHDLA